MILNITIFVLLVLLSIPAHASVTVTPTSIHFGQLAVGTVSLPKAVTETNTGTQDINIVSAVLSANQFSYSGLTLPIILIPGQSLIAFVQFEPLAEQLYTGTLVFTRANGSTIAISLRGTGAQTQEQSPTITTRPSSQTITAGQTARFSVAAGTAPLTHQWNKNAAAISNATSSSYTTPAETIAHNNAQFTVKVP
jgi:hypothetical protein